MAITVEIKGSTIHRVTCAECGATFTYEISDIHPNYVHGGEWVGCPTCGKPCRHMGAWRRQ
jgi:endogenous inhibitor of DNA gyrase (YacG/DUF329 family)